MPTHGLSKSLPAEVAAGDEVTHLGTLGAIAVFHHTDYYSDRLDTRPLFLQRKIVGQLREIIVSFIRTTMALLTRLVPAIARVPKIIFGRFVKERLNRLILLRLILFDRQDIVATAIDNLLGNRFLATHRVDRHDRVC